MHPNDQVPGSPRVTAERRPWQEVLRALREGRGITQEGWAARLGVSRKTVQRWESGERAPDPGAERAILAYCREAGLLRSFDRGPLAGLTLTEAGLRDLVGEARWRGGGREVAAEPPAGAHRTGGDAHPTNLPAHLTSFVGRERELAAVRRVQAGTRLLTLTGPGGCGKTRLALALAGELLWAYPHGVWFVNLAPLPSAGSEGGSPQTSNGPALVPQVVASALVIRTTGQQPLTAALIDALRARHLLLLLDNCEHLLPACAELVEALLRACPHLEVVATSRESLGVNGETVWRVPPLSLPETADRGARSGQRTTDVDNGGAEAPVASDAVRLFVERARLQRSEFALTAGNAAAVEEICRRLDGMPLAIELAAARVSVLSAAQIADRLQNRFQLLTNGGRTALPRHQTLRAAMDWSHDLLTAAERVLLRALSVFAGGFTLEAAEAVCSDREQGTGNREQGGPCRTVPCSQFPVPSADVLDLLTRLVDKSLVIADEHGARSGSDGVRYRMLETVRQYAEEKLNDAGEATAMRERHAAWCLALAEAAEPHSRGPEQGAWLEWLSVEHDNLRAALGWCLSDERGAAMGLRLGGTLAWFWEVRGHLSEGRRWLEVLLARGGTAPPDVRAKALNGAGVLARAQGDDDAAERLHEQSLALRRELGDEAGISNSLNNLGVVTGARGDHARARTLFEESLALRRKLGGPWLIAQCIWNLGIVARQQGEPDRAEALYEEALALMRELGDRRSVATLLQNLGNVHQDQGALDRAAARCRESLCLYQELQDRMGTARCLHSIAGVAATRGDARLAARLCGAAAALREVLGVPLEAPGRDAFERITAAARAALGEADFAVAWAAGQAMSLEQAIAEALAATADR